MGDKNSPSRFSPPSSLSTALAMWDLPASYLIWTHRTQWSRVRLLTKPGQSESFSGVVVWIWFVPLKLMWRFNPHYEVLNGENLVHLLCFLMTRDSMSLDMTGSDWGLRKKTQRQTYRKAWIGWVQHS
jgi:hypothetical protein